MQYVIAGLTLGLSAAASPGPLQAYLLSSTMRNGWRRTLPASLAPLLSDGPIVALVVLLLTQTPPALLRGLRFAGGVFLLYLAYGAWMAFQETSSPTQVSHRTPNSLLQAAMINLLNPAPYIFWATVAGPLLLQGWALAPSRAISFITAFYSSLMGGMAALILLFSLARNLGPRVTRTLNGFSSLALALFGLYQLWTAIAG